MLFTSARQGSRVSWLGQFRTKARHIIQGYLWPSIPQFDRTRCATSMTWMSESRKENPGMVN